MNRRQAARMAETKFPRVPGAPAYRCRQAARAAIRLCELLAGDTMKIARDERTGTAGPDGVDRRSAEFRGRCGDRSALADPGGSRLPRLWHFAAVGGHAQGWHRCRIYDIVVQPGNKTVRRKSDQLITARLAGFSSDEGPACSRNISGASKWEQVNMTPQPEGNGFEFLFGGLAEQVEYFVEAGSVQSKHFNLKVVDLPGVKKVRVTYHFPKWTGMKDATEDPGGDLRAVEGTEAEVSRHHRQAACLKASSCWPTTARFR